jgi:dipeptidyl aminopeptidase/acylaminoacyl peptidase
MRQTNPNPLLRNPRALTIFVIIVFLLVALCLGAFLIAQGVPNRNLGQLFAAATPTKAVIAPTNTPQVFITVVVVEPPTLVSTPAPAITLVPTKTLTPTVVIAQTATHTPTVKPTAAITSSATITTSVTPTTTVTATTTVARTPTRPPAPAGSIAYRFNDSGTNRVRMYNFDGNRSTPLLNIGPSMDETFGTNAPIGGWSPDNSKFAFVTSETSNAANVLRVYDLQSSTSRSIYSSDANGGGLSSPVWSADGTKIAVIKMSANQRYWTIELINADGTRCSAAYECEITSNPQGEQFRGGLSWSKQGLFALAINSSGASDVYTMFGDGSVRAQLTNDPADDTTPALSPDGKSLAFTSNRDGVSQIYWVNTDGSGLRKLSQGNHSDFSPFWSPDGNWIAFASTRNGATDIYMMDRNGGNVTRLTTTGGDRPSWTR